MTLLSNTIALLEEYNLSPDRGFLPSQDPLQKLPVSFKDWEKLSKHFTDYLNAGIIRQKILELPIIENPVLKNQREQERAMLILSKFAHAYVNSAPEKKDYIPSNIAIPYLKVAQQLGRTPVMAHASLVLNNWRRINQDKPIKLDNLALLHNFHGGLDESWFYLITVQIEKEGGPAIGLLLDGLNFLKNGDLNKVKLILQDVIIHLENMINVLKRMYENCEPSIFYKRIRPFLDSFIDIDYQGTSLGKQSFHGGSAAQSSLIQFFDAIMGNNYHGIPTTHNYLLEMRKYMPLKHANFLRFIESNKSYKDFLKQSPPLESPFSKIKTLLIEFRNEHLKMVSIYIMKQAKENNKEAIGTGGTNPLLFLKSIRNKNQEK